MRNFRAKEGSIKTLRNVALSLIVAFHCMAEAAGADARSVTSKGVKPVSTRVACSKKPAAGSLTLSAVPARSTGIAPLMVVFDATGTTSGITSFPFHDVDYRWDFGDPGAGNWFPTDGSGIGVPILTRSGGVATATTSSPHGYSTGDRIRIRGAAQPQYNGEVVVTVTNATQFTYAVLGTPVSPATGTIVAANRALGPSRNAASGPVAAHVFETPGTYTVTMTASDGTTNSGSCSLSITVQDPATAFPGGTVCVSSTSLPVAGAGGCPAGAAVQLQANFPTILSSIVASNKRVLLKGGDVFTGPASATLSNKSTGTIGAYPPNGARAIIRTTSPTAFTAMLTLNGTTNDWRFMDLDFDGQSNVKNTGIVYDGAQTRLTFLRVDIHHVSGGIDSDINGASVLPDQFGFVDSAIRDRVCDISTFSGGYHNGSKNFATMGSLFSNQSGCFHNVRINWSILGVFSNNQVDHGPSSGQELWTLRAVCSTSTCPGSVMNLSLLSGAAAATRFNVISNNYFIGTGNAGGVTLKQVNGGDSALFHDHIFERNYFTTESGGKVALDLSGSELTVRNNLFNNTNGDTGTGFAFVNGASGPLAATTNAWIYNNTLFGPATFTGVMISYASGTTGVARNNLGYTPGSASAVMVSGGGGLTASNNSTNAQLRTVSPSFTATPPTTAAQFKPTAGYALGGGFAAPRVPVWSDYFSVCTPGSLGCAAGTPTIGAIALPHPAPRKN